MNKRTFACVVCGLALAGSLAAGCVPEQSQVASAPSPARIYITSVHQVYDNIDTQMDALKGSAAAGDFAAVSAALDKVDAQVAALEGLEVPAGLEELQNKYVTATKTLETAVRQYADYRLNKSNAVTIDSIRESYAAGIQLLQEADNLAKAL